MPYLPGVKSFPPGARHGLLHSRPSPDRVGRLMPDFDILGANANAYGAQPGSFGSGLYQALTAQQGGASQQGQGQNGRVFNSVPLASQPQQQAQPGAPISGLVAGALGLPTVAGADPGTAYLAQQPQQQANGGQGQQPQQMSGLMAGILGMPQSGQAAGQQGQQQPNGAQPQNNMGSNIGGLLRAMIYNGQSQDV